MTKIVVASVGAAILGMLIDHVLFSGGAPVVDTQARGDLEILRSDLNHAISVLQGSLDRSTQENFIAAATRREAAAVPTSGRGEAADPKMETEVSVILEEVLALREVVRDLIDQVPNSMSYLRPLLKDSSDPRPQAVALFAADMRSARDKKAFWETYSRLTPLEVLQKFGRPTSSSSTSWEWTWDDSSTGTQQVGKMRIRFVGDRMLVDELLTQ